MTKAFKLVLDLAGIQSVIVFGETADQLTEFWNKVQIGQDWANVDLFRCCYLQDFRYFNLDDACIGETHAVVQKEVDRYPKCQALKLSYFSMARTLITDSNVEQAAELITEQAVQAIKSAKSLADVQTDQFCFTCQPAEREKILGQFQQIDDTVSREVGMNMRCDSWEFVHGDENGCFVVLRFYFEKL